MHFPKIFAWITAVYLLLCVHANAVEFPVIKEVRFEGLNYISPLIANEITKVRLGEPLDIEQVDRSVRDFYMQGYFQDIWITEENGILTYHFVEKPVIASLVVSGYGAGKEQKQIDREIGLKKGDVYDANTIASVRRRITRLLEAQGFYDSVVEVKTEEISKNALKVTLEINKGESIFIQEANYYGRNNISLSRIESVSANKERDFMGWMWGLNSGKMQITELEADRFRIRDLYWQKGYLDAQISPPFLRTDFTTYHATLDYHIDEGKRYMVSEVEIVLEEDVIPVEKLYKLLKLQKGKVYNIVKMRSDVEAIRYRVGDLGYAFVRVTPDLDKNQENGEVRLVYYVQPGRKVRIKDVIISGNNKTLDRVIRRNVLLAPGEQYAMRKIQNSKNAILRTGGFESVEIEEERIDEEHINLLVKVKEGKTGEFAFGVGYGSFDGLMGNVSIKDRNIFGTGLTAGVYFDKSEVSTSYRFNLYNPAVFDSAYSLSTDIYQSDYESFDYRETSTGLSLVGGRRIFDHLELTLGYTQQRTRLDNFNNAFLQQLYTQFYLGNYLKYSVIPGISYDSTDAYFFVRNGVRASANLEYAGFSGDADFIKYHGSFNYYKSVDEWVDLDVIFRYRARVGYVEDKGYLPIGEKFYLGGINSVRGYESRSITPFDQFGLRIGGRKYFYNTAELSYGLFETVQMRLAVFYDFGMIGDMGFGDIKRSSAGIGIEWLSPVGLIHFIFPRAIRPKEGDRTSSFEFTLGQRF